MDTLRYFSRSYADARERLYRCAYSAGGEVAMPHVMVDRRGAGGEELATDVVRFGPKDAEAVEIGRASGRERV